MKQSKLHAFVIAAFFFALPLASAAQEAEIIPNYFDFGNVCIGNTTTDDFTITSAIDDDLRIFAAAYLTGDNPSGAYSMEFLDDYGHSMPLGSFVTVEVTYGPVNLGIHDARLTVVTNDGTNPIQSVPHTGQGVACDPTTEIVDQLIADIESGEVELVGIGPGASASGRYGAFLNMLKVTYGLLDAGLVDDACEQLGDAFDRVDGQAHPPDFVTGPDADYAYDEIVEALHSLGCI